MKQLWGILFCLLCLASCRPQVIPEIPLEEETPAPDPDPDPQPEPQPEPVPALQFAGPWEDLYLGETTSAACDITHGVTGKSYRIVYTSSDNNVASVSDDGTVLAKKAGITTITARIEGTEVVLQRKYFVNDLAILKQPYSKDLIFFYGHTIYYKSVVQSWDFFDDYFYACQVCGAPHTLSYTRKPVMSQNPQEYMHLKYFGHGDNMFVERAPDGDYLWTSNYGTLEAGETNRYADSQVLSRVKFEPGKTMEPQYINDNYVIPGMKRLVAAYDAPNGNVGIWCRDGSGQAWFFVYPMQAMKDAPVESIKLTYSRTYGNPAVTDTPTVKARNLANITPVLKFKMPLSNVPQGYDFHHNRLYMMRGAGAEPEDVAAGTGKNWARIYMINPYSARVVTQVDVPWVINLSLLKSEGFTDLGYFEPEGIKFKDGVIYLGFASKDAGSSPARRVNLFKYQLH